MKKLTLFICMLFLFTSCEKEFDNVIDSHSIDYSFKSPSIPAVVDYSANPVVIPTIEVRNLPAGSVVWFDVVSLYSDEILNSKVLMNDDGQIQTSGDVTPNDNIYSGKYSFSNTAFSGNYEFSFYVKTVSLGGDETTTKIAFKTIEFKGVQRNEPPVISNLNLPAAIDPNVDVTITLKVSDANGLSDLGIAWFRMTDPNGLAYQINVYLYDDGSSANITDEFTGFPKLSGDITSGDGIYSRKFSFNSSAVKGDWTFTFQAKDNSNANSNTITQKMTLR